MKEKPKMCPECMYEELVYTGDRMSESGEHYDVGVYECPKCKVEFDTDELEES